MTLYPKPTKDHPFFSWFLYVSCGETEEGIRARMQECPEELREAVAKRTREFFEESRRMRSKDGVPTGKRPSSRQKPHR